MSVQKAEIIFCIVETKGAERDWGYKPILENKVCLKSKPHKELVVDQQDSTGTYIVKQDNLLVLKGITVNISTRQ
jgi:hypothetical protein